MFLLFSSIFVFTNAYALSGDDFNWKVASKRNNITVFKADKHESGIVPIKVETIFQFLRILLHWPGRRFVKLILFLI